MLFKSGITYLLYLSLPIFKTMYRQQPFQCYDIFDISSNPALDFPFNLTFKPKKEFNGDFTGPGIYILSYKGNVIYIGKFDSLDKSDIRFVRWERHMETITLRGRRVGFGKKKYSKISTLFNDEFKNSVSEKSLIFKDTGVVTSKKRIAFAMSNWKEFSQLNIDNLKSFTIDYFKFDTPEKKFEMVVNKIEKDIIPLINPPCNYQYKVSQETMKFDDAIKLCNKYFQTHSI